MPCARCENAASYQWQICADGNLYRTICNACDDELNELVLKFFGFKDWRDKIQAYKDQKYGEAAESHN